MVETTLFATRVQLAIGGTQDLRLVTFAQPSLIAQTARVTKCAQFAGEVKSLQQILLQMNSAWALRQIALLSTLQTKNCALSAIQATLWTQLLDSACLVTLVLEEEASTSAQLAITTLLLLLISIAVQPALGASQQLQTVKTV